MEHPHNPNINPLAPLECLFEGVDVNGELVDIMMTYNYFTPDTDRQCWQLTVSSQDKSGEAQASGETTMKVILSILGQGSYIEITEGIPKQFRKGRLFMREDNIYNVEKGTFG